MCVSKAIARWNRRYRIRWAVLYILIGIATYGTAVAECRRTDYKVGSNCKDYCVVSGLVASAGWPLYWSGRVQRDD